jgi:hypothetical protein
LARIGVGGTPTQPPNHPNRHSAGIGSEGLLARIGVVGTPTQPPNHPNRHSAGIGSEGLLARIGVVGIGVVRSERMSSGGGPVRVLGVRV